VKAVRIKVRCGADCADPLSADLGGFLVALVGGEGVHPVGPRVRRPHPLGRHPIMVESLFPAAIFDLQAGESGHRFDIVGVLCDCLVV